jgi:CheY-like chemotaxis protein
MDQNRPSGPDPASLRVLLVEDEELVRLTVSGLLTGLGHRVEPSFDDGRQALAAIAAGRVVDVALLDYHLPGLTGLETLAGLRALRPGLPAILVTGSFHFQGTPTLAAPGPLALLLKPFSLEALRETLATIV